MRQCRFQNNWFIYSEYKHSGKRTTNVSYSIGSLVLSRSQDLNILFYFDFSPPYDFIHYLMYLSPSDSSPASSWAGASQNICCFILDCCLSFAFGRVAFFFFFITVSLTLGGGPMIGMMCEETVRCFIGFACSVVECQHQTFSSFTLLVLCSCFSKSTVLFFFFYSIYKTQDFI